MTTVTDQNITDERIHAETIAKIHAKIAVEFAKYGKEWAYRDGNQQYRWAEPLYIYMGIERYRGGWGNSYNGNTELVLSARYWGDTVDKHGNLNRFVNRSRKISLSKPIEDVLKLIEEYIATLPAKLVDIHKATEIRQRIEDSRAASADKHHQLTRQLSEITGYKIEYGDIKTYDWPTGLKTPYKELKIIGDSPVVKVTMEIPLDEFEAFHKQFCAGNVAKSE